jgi:glycosyltransferase involved in cell wall biosynthesis
VIHQRKQKKTTQLFFGAKKKMSLKIALTTITYNDRPTLPLVVKQVLAHTNVEKVTWYILMQNCTDVFAQQIVALCENRIKLVLVRFKKNLGLSKAMSYAIKLTTEFQYVLNIEDDWVLLHKRIPDKDWLQTCIRFMDTNPCVSTIFLRAYATDREKWQYGWTRTIPYVCHKHKNNFNYAEKIQHADKISFATTVTFQHIPDFLFTFNPCFVRNLDYHRTAYPLPVFDLDQKINISENKDWGCCEALTMEKTRHLTTYWFNEGIFGHYEDWFSSPTAAETYATSS